MSKKETKMKEIKKMNEEKELYVLLTLDRAIVMGIYDDYELARKQWLKYRDSMTDLVLSTRVLNKEF